VVTRRPLSPYPPIPAATPAPRQSTAPCIPNLGGDMSIGMNAGTATALCPFPSSHRATECDALAVSP